MAVDIEIKQRGLFKRELNIDDIAAGKYRYGVIDEYWRLEEGSLDGENIIFYDPEHIGRGVEICWKLGIKDSISIRLPLPTTHYDIDMCFDIVRNICQVWKAKSFLVDDAVVSVNDIEECINIHKENSFSIFTSMNEDKMGDECMILFCVMFPLGLKAQTLYEYGENKDWEGFAELLHSKQAEDLYYAVPRIYRMKDGTYFGGYAIGADIDSIIPIKPEVPLMMTDPDTGEALKCDKFVVMLGSQDNPNIGGTISYGDFAEGIGLSQLEAFDENHVILRNFTESMVEELANRYSDPLA